MTIKSVFPDFTPDCSIVPTGATSTVPAMLVQSANGNEFAITECGEIFTYTAAIEGGADVSQAKMLAGHRVGISDHYLKRNPCMVANACAAIEKSYFG